MNAQVDRLMNESEKRRAAAELEEARKLARMGFLSPQESFTQKTKGRVAAFALGIVIAWLGLPAAIHLAYWGAIAVAGLAGYWIGHR